jgi:hypothetical protein
MKFAGVFAKRTPYLVWLVVSSVILVVCCFIDPHIFGFAAYATAGISALLAAVSAYCGWRTFLLAALACLPTVAAFALLSTYRWG